MDFSDCFSPHLSAAELRAPRELTIADAWVEAFNQKAGPDKRKLVLSFRGMRQSVVVSASNAKTLATAFRVRDTDALRGRRVRLETRQTNLGPGLLVVPLAPPAAGPAVDRSPEFDQTHREPGADDDFAEGYGDE